MEEILLSKCGMCDIKRLKFIKEQEASRLSSSQGIKTPLSKIHLIGHLLSQRSLEVNISYKMNKIVKTFSLAEDKFMPEMYLKQPEVLYKVLQDCLQKTNKESKNLKKKEIDEIVIKAKQIKFVFNVTWLMQVLNI